MAAKCYALPGKDSWNRKRTVVQQQVKSKSSLEINSNLCANVFRLWSMVLGALIVTSQKKVKRLPTFSSAVH